MKRTHFRKEQPMLELHLQRADNTLTISLGDHTDTIPFTDIALTEEKIEHIHHDAASYGRALFDQTFRTEDIRNKLASLRANERLVLVAEDPLVASIPWDYLRDQNNKLLASRLTFVRGLPQTRRQEDFTFSGALEIVALPVSPVDVQPVLDVEGEWKNLVEAVSTSQPPKALTVKRVLPPTRSQLERSLNRRSTSIVHFMGHSTSSRAKRFLAFED